MNKLSFSEGVLKERKRILEWVHAARKGDVDNDLRSILYYINGGEDLAKFMEEFDD